MGFSKKIKKTMKKRKDTNLEVKTMKKRYKKNQKGGTEGQTLWQASQNGHLEVVTALLGAGADVSNGDTDGRTPLLLASCNGHVEVVTVLLGAGADVNQTKTDTGSTPLYTASLNGHVEVVTVLLGVGADVNKARTDYGASPLWIASQNGHLEIVNALLGAGADVNKARTDNGVTPLYMASKNGHVEVVEILNKVANDGFQLYTHSKESDKNGVTEILNKYNKDTLEKFKRALVDASHEGYTPLIMASFNGNDDVVSALLDAGATPDKAYKNTIITPLLAAIAGKYNDTKSAKSAKVTNYNNIINKLTSKDEYNNKTYEYSYEIRDTINTIDLRDFVKDYIDKAAAATTGAHGNGHADFVAVAVSASGNGNATDDVSAAEADDDNMKEIAIAVADGASNVASGASDVEVTGDGDAGLVAVADATTSEATVYGDTTTDVGAVAVADATTSEATVYGDTTTDVGTVAVAVAKADEAVSDDST